MLDFDPRNPPSSKFAKHLSATPARIATFGCPICGRVRFSPYEIAFDDVVVIASGQPNTCGFCGDGCFR